jgi:hypothetical protein
MSLRWPGLLAAGWLCIAGPVLAHEESSPEPSPYMDCSQPAAGTFKGVPDPLAQWSRLECTPIGQMLVAHEDWIWRYPASFTDRPFVPAWLTADPTRSPDPRVFKSIKLRQGTADDLGSLKQRLQKTSIDLPAPDKGAGPERLYVVVAESNFGEAFEVNFIYRSDDDIWAITCAPACAPEQVFKIYRR